MARRCRPTTTTAPPPCTPTGDLTPWPQETYRCADETCKAVLHHVRAGALVNDWIVVDEAGSNTRDDRPALLRDDPKAWWDRLAKAMLAGDALAGNLYSLMSTQNDWAGRRWIHIHRCGDRVNPRPERDVPTCCTQPMRAAPDGWTCRISGVAYRAK